TRGPIAMNHPDEDLVDSSDPPVRDAAPQAPEPGIALCLSGGGYRAMVFHLGALWRLNQVGLLPQLKRISSVSTGSTTAAVLGLKWGELGFGAGGVAERYDLVVDAVRRLASVTVDTASILGGLLFTGGAVGDRMTATYDKHLFAGATLQELPQDGAG